VVGKTFEQLIDENQFVATTGLVVAEILRGCAQESLVSQLQESLLAFPVFEASGHRADPGKIGSSLLIKGSRLLDAVWHPGMIIEDAPRTLKARPGSP
jgi:hypothetical protein